MAKGWKVENRGGRQISDDERPNEIITKPIWIIIILLCVQNRTYVVCTLSEHVIANGFVALWRSIIGVVLMITMITMMTPSVPHR